MLQWLATANEFLSLASLVSIKPTAAAADISATQKFYIQIHFRIKVATG